MKRIFLIIPAVFALALMPLAAAYAQEVGTVTYSGGRVDIFPNGSSAAVPVSEGYRVSVGDSVRVKSGSKAEVTFDDTSRVRIAENTKVAVSDYRLNPDKTREKAVIRLDRGKIRSIISKGAGAATFEIVTPNASGTVKGSDVYSFFQMGNTGMLVSQGVLSVSSVSRPDSVLSVPAGNAILVSADGASKGPRPYLGIELTFNRKETDIPERAFRRERITAMRGTLARVAGAVTITDKAGSESAARAGDIVEEGHTVSTGADGSAEIVFDNGSAIYLKSGTNISVLTLAVDPKTGDYENRFSSDGGKIKARIEKLGGRSKFEVKTPIALCGARGTIMYLDIAQNGATNAFFEGGSGYAQSSITGQTREIGAGEGSDVGIDGTISDPSPITQEERLEMDEGWGDSGEGQPSPDGAAGEYLFDAHGSSGGFPAGSLIEVALAAIPQANPLLRQVETTVDVPITVADPNAGTSRANDSTGNESYRYLESAY